MPIKDKAKIGVVVRQVNSKRKAKETVIDTFSGVVVDSHNWNEVSSKFVEMDTNLCNIWMVHDNFEKNKKATIEAKSEDRLLHSDLLWKDLRRIQRKGKRIRHS